VTAESHQPHSANQSSATPSPTLSDSDAPLVWIIVLHWQGAEFTRACLTSLQNLDYPYYQVLLVDNGSPDHSGPDIAASFPNVTLLSLPENLGFAGGCNAGIIFALEKDANWIWLINNDTVIPADCLSILMRNAVQNPQAGALGAVVHTGNDRVSISGPGTIDFARAKTFLKEEIPSTETVSCDWVSGCNLLLRADALRQAGLFDEDYFLYFEDTELCHRLRQYNWSCLLVTGAHIKHVGSASTQGSRSVWRAYYYIRNRLLFFHRNSPGATFLIAWFSMFTHLIRHALVLPFRGERGRNQLRAEYLGFRDYVCNRLGRAQCLDWCDRP